MHETVLAMTKDRRDSKLPCVRERRGPITEFRLSTGIRQDGPRLHEASGERPEKINDAGRKATGRTG
eukprot:7980727-Alexandrium_andersonii.AAC.1